MNNFRPQSTHETQRNVEDKEQAHLLSYLLHEMNSPVSMAAKIVDEICAAELLPTGIQHKAQRLGMLVRMGCDRALMWSGM